jgi:hypothetical protein
MVNNLYKSLEKKINVVIVFGWIIVQLGCRSTVIVDNSLKKSY